jgi:hypothetical protein
LALIALLAVPPYARGADRAICRELENKFETSKSGITAIGLNAMLFNAAGKGCEGLAYRLLAAGASLRARDRDGAMALAHAAGAGHAALVATFLDLGAPINARDIAGSTALTSPPSATAFPSCVCFSTEVPIPICPGAVGLCQLPRRRFAETSPSSRCSVWAVKGGSGGRLILRSSFGSWRALTCRELMIAQFVKVSFRHRTFAGNAF